jgi:hypothetical protein
MSRILIVTIALSGRSGTEIVTFETARGLRARGHEVAIFCPKIGPLGDALKRDGFVVVEDTASVPWMPDIIQANHSYPLIEAFARFPHVPILSICHDATVWFNEPLYLPTICKYAAVSLACRDRVARQFPYLAGDIELLHNAVDLDAFRVRAPLSIRPQRALIVAHRNNGHIPAIRAACARVGVDVDAVGSGVGTVVEDLPARLVQYDLVFAIGRMALEALAVGCAVVVVDERGLAGMVTTDVLPSWRDHNFGFALLTRPLSVDALVTEVNRYDAINAGQVSEFVRRRSSLSLYLDRLEEIHRYMRARNALVPVDRDASMLHLGKAFRALFSAFEDQMQDAMKMALSRTADCRLPRLFPRWLKRLVKSSLGKHI